MHLWNIKDILTIDSDILIGNLVLFNDWILLLHPYVEFCAKSWSNHTAAVERKLRLIAMLWIG